MIKIRIPIIICKEYNQKLAAVVSGIDTDWLSKPLRNGVGTKFMAFRLKWGMNV